MKRKAPKGQRLALETTSVRLPPKLRYGLDLLARYQRRSMTSLIESAMQAALETARFPVTKVDRTTTPPSLFNEVVEAPFAALVNLLWDVDQCARIVKLASHTPELMTFEEEKIFKVLFLEPRFWQGGPPLENPDWKEIERQWPIIQRRAAGEDVDFLP